MRDNNKVMVDINQVNDEGDTSLMLGAARGDTKTVISLLNSGANVNQVNNDGYTALIWAVVNGHTETTNVLLQAGANFDKTDNYGNTALIWAARYGHTEISSALLNAQVNVDRAKNNIDMALIEAVINFQTETVNFLLDKGADVNKSDRTGNTALNWAIRRGDTTIINDIIKNTALNQRNNGDSWNMVLEQLNWLDEDQYFNVINNLDRQTATLMATILPESEESLRNIIIGNFNNENYQNSIDQKDQSEINELRQLKTSLEQRFLENQGENDTNAQSLAIIAIGYFVMNRACQEDFKDYLSNQSRHLIHNPRLDKKQNLIVAGVLQDLLKPNLTPTQSIKTKSQEANQRPSTILKTSRTANPVLNDHNKCCTVS